MHQATKQDAERGQALIEFALTVPIFLMLVFGIIDLARLIFAYTQVIDAARQGVRYGIVEGLEKGNYQYLNCAGIEHAVRDTPGLVPGSSLTVTISYLNPIDNKVEITHCGVADHPSYEDVQYGAVLAVKVGGSITPVTPVLAMFDDNISFDYTSKRTIADKGAYYTEEWPSAPPVPKNFRADPDCTAGRVYFYWDPMQISSDAVIEIRDSFTGETVVTITDPDTQYAFCKDGDPPERVEPCGVDISPTDGYGMWYMVVIQNGLEGTSSDDDSAECHLPPPGEEGSGTASISGTVWWDMNKDQVWQTTGKDKEDAYGNFTVTLKSAGPDGVAGNGDDVSYSTVTDKNKGTFTFSNLPIPTGLSAQDFYFTIAAPAGYEVTTANGGKHFFLADGEAVTGQYIGIGPKL
jgi:hypothetical protein